MNARAVGVSTAWQAKLVYGVDPAKRGVWVACFSDRRLVKTFFTSDYGLVEPADHVFIEKPQVYQVKRGRGAKPSDLIDLAMSAQDFISRGKHKRVTWYLPGEWKKRLDKVVCHNRMWCVLEEPERAVLPPRTRERIDRGLKNGAYSWQGHNVLDAVSIGLVGLGRLTI